MRRALLLACAVPAALAGSLRAQMGVEAVPVAAPVTLAPVTPSPETTVTADARPDDCVESAKTGMEDLFKTVEEVQEGLNTLDDGSSCKLDDSGVQKAKGKLEKIKQEATALKKQIADYEANDVCQYGCELSMSQMNAMAENDEYPYGSCDAMKKAIKGLEDLNGLLKAKEAEIGPAKQNIADAEIEMKRAYNACICKAESNLNSQFKKVNDHHEAGQEKRVNTLLLDKRVICASEAAAKNAAVDSCDDIKLTSEEEEKLKLIKPTLAKGLKCEPEIIIEPPLMPFECKSASDCTGQESKYCKNHCEAGKCFIECALPAPEPLPPVIKPIIKPMPIVGGPDEHGCMTTLGDEYRERWDEKQQKCVLVNQPVIEPMPVIKPMPMPMKDCEKATDCPVTDAKKCMPKCVKNQCEEVCKVEGGDPGPIDEPAPEEPKICCKAMTADCLSCSKGVTVEEYCKTNPKTEGCAGKPKAPKCDKELGPPAGPTDCGPQPKCASPPEGCSYKTEYALYQERFCCTMPCHAVDADGNDCKELAKPSASRKYKYEKIGNGWCVSNSGKGINSRVNWPNFKWKKQKNSADGSCKWCEDECNKDDTCVGYLTEDGTKCDTLHKSDTNMEDGLIKVDSEKRNYCWRKEAAAAAADITAAPPAPPAMAKITSAR